LFIEAKSLPSELDDKNSTQTISYGKAEDVRWVALTNGKLLKIFDTTKSGKSEKDNLICEINLSDALNYLDELALLHKESLSSGETERIADRFFQRRLAISRMRGGENKLSEGITNLLTGIVGDAYKEQAKEVASQLASQATELIEKKLLSQAPAGGVTPPSMPERHKLRLEFWKQLLEFSKSKTQLFSKISPGKENWVNRGAGKSGLAYGYIILKHSASIELYIDTGDATRNKKIFDQLYNHKQKTETEFGESLLWDRIDEKRACRISKMVDNKGLYDKDNWSETIEKMVNTMINFEKIMSLEIKQLS
jgi:hypothetical protein